IALIDNNTLIVSDWVNLTKPEGVIKKINLLTLEVTPISSDLIGGPADFYFDSKANQLIVPATQQEMLLRLSLSKKDVQLKRNLTEN
ncbi:MAG: hypothetical protein C0490_19250, partial [Marivirga sp.]|nr:hypothetical protein [Marivirga sp.]